MAARLFCRTGDLSGSDFTIAAEVQIGSAATSDIRLNADGVRDTHARIYQEQPGGAYMVEAIDGATVRVDSMEVGTSFRLEELNVITFAGRHDFFFQVMDTAWKPSLPPTESSGEEGGVPGLQTQIGAGFHPLPGALTDRKSADTDAPVESVKEDPGLVTRQIGEFTPGLPTFEKAEESAPAEDPMLRTRPAGDFSPGLPTFQTPSGPTGPAAEPISPGEQPAESLAGTPAGLTAETPAGPTAETPAGPAAETQDASQGRFHLSVTGLDGAVREFALKEGENVIGRSAECDLHLDDASLSRRHAMLLLRDSGVTIRDLGSKNGTYVDDERIASDVSLTSSSSVRLGHVIEANLLVR